MEYLKFSNMLSSKIGFGCCPLGGHGWGNNVEEFILFSAIHKAIELGINFFDTADVYGLGLSEVRLGKVLSQYPRDQFIIATKCGVRFDNNNKRFYDNSKTWLKQALDSSLKRLNSEYIDLYQIHYWDEKTTWDDIIDNLQNFQKQGKIKHFGVTNIDISKFTKLQIDSISSFSYEYSLLKRDFEFLINNIIKKNTNLIFLSWGSLAQGLLSGKYNKKSIFSETDRRSRASYSNFHSTKINHNLKLIALFEKMRQEYYPVRTLSQLSLRWILDTFKSVITLVGIKNTDQIQELSLCANWKLETRHKKLLDKIFMPETIMQESSFC